MSKRLELTGQRFGRLTVIEYSHTNKKRAFWKCLCNCGKYTTVRGYSLKNGSTKSCGCLQKERVREITNKRTLPEGEAARNIVVYKHKRSAKRTSRVQALTDEQIIELHKGNCYYCGTPPSNVCFNRSCNGSYIYNGIDRVDNTKGYTLTNVVPCCKFCNQAKKDLTYDEFLDKIKRIYSYLNLS